MERKARDAAERARGSAITVEQRSARADDDAVNTAVVVGSDVTFSCRSSSAHRPHRANTTTSSSFRWYHYRPSSVRPLVVHTGLHRRREFAERHDVVADLATGFSRLAIGGVRLEDAGVYSCYELSARPTAARLAFQLTVLGKTPRLNYTPTLFHNITTQKISLNYRKYRTSLHASLLVSLRAAVPCWLLVGIKALLVIGAVRKWC